MLHLLFFLMIRHPPRSTLLTHSLPTRRSSDLADRQELCLGRAALKNITRNVPAMAVVGLRKVEHCASQIERPFAQVHGSIGIAPQHGRSEEHTSELQSLMRISYAVFCLKKKHTHPHHTTDNN